MTWNHRIVKKTSEYGDYYAIHEVFYNPDGSIWGCTEDGVDVGGDSLEDVLELYEMMKEAFNAPVLNYEDMPGDDLTEEDYLAMAEQDEIEDFFDDLLGGEDE